MCIRDRGNSWKVGNTLKLTLDTPDAPILRDGANGKELLVPVTVDGKAIMRAKYEWDLN